MPAIFVLAVEEFEPLVENARSRAAFAEIPMLLEAGWLAGGAVDMAVGVSCPEDVRHGRLANKRGWDRQTIALMDSWQWPEDKKMGACAHVVDNSGPLDVTLANVGVLLSALRRERAGRAASLLAWMRSKGYA